MELEKCKSYLRGQGIEVSNLSEETIMFLCDEAFEDIKVSPPPDVNSVDPAERVKAGIQELDDYLKGENAKSSILNLISDAIDMSAKKEDKPSEL